MLTRIALVEPLAVAWHAVDATYIEKGDDALVLGAGPIGLGVIQCLKARGANQIFVAEVAAERQNFAKHFGATHIFDPTKEDVVARCKELTGGRGPQIALDCAGVAASIKTATLAVRARGRIVNVAIWEKVRKESKAVTLALTKHRRSHSTPTIWFSGRRSILRVCVAFLNDLMIVH